MPARASILHVENDKDDVFVTQRAFKKAGVTVPIAAVENGEQAVDYLLGNGKFTDRAEYPLPTVIILDWNMPLMSGSEFLVWRSSQPEIKRIPVVVLTSSNNERDMIEAYDLGSSGFVVKPSTLASLQEMALAFANYWVSWNRTERAAVWTM
jgi:CheY-like chemotaxis protein